MYNFEFEKPKTVADAVAALAAEDAQALGGGQTLIPTLKQRLASPTKLVSLAGIAETKGIKREGDMLAIGFSPRKANMVFYLAAGNIAFEGHLARLGKHRVSKACLYITDLDKVDMNVLEEMCTIAYQDVREKYH